MPRVFFLSLIFSALSFGAPDFNAFVEGYFEKALQDSPTFATSIGVHQYDANLEDYSRPGIFKRISWLKEQLGAFSHFNLKELTEEARIDWTLLKNYTQAQILELEEIRNWERNPDYYSSGITQSAYVIISRAFAPEEERLKVLIARESRMPQVLKQARVNLKNPPKIFTEVAIEQVSGNLSFFEKDVPKAFANIKNPKLLKSFSTTNKAVIAALKEYRTYLEKMLLPKSKGDFRIGVEKYRKKLLFDEMVDMPLEKLLKIGNENLKANQERFIAVGRELDPKKDPKQILQDLEKDHVAPESLLQSVRDVNETLVQFLEEKKIVTIPSSVRPLVEETPPFLRALTFASMDTPGPFETRAKEAYYNITLPEKDWPQERVEEHMAGFNRGTVLSTSIHEAYPGHYTQFLWLQKANLSKVRKIVGCSSNAEGWAHYTEQMVLDEGFAKGDLKMRLGQLQDALLRNARFIVGIQMHRGNMTFDEGVKFFMTEGFQTKANAERETKRGTSDPTYLYYTLGKLEIFKLREDYKKLKGSSYSLKEFHDTFLQQGFPPIPIVRTIMLGSVGEVL